MGWKESGGERRKKTHFFFTHGWSIHDCLLCDPVYNLNNNVQTCDSFDYGLVMENLIVQERKKNTTFSTIWCSVDNTVCIGIGIVCNFADKKPIW